MARGLVVSPVCAFVLLTGCTSIVFDSDMGNTRRLFELKRPGGVTNVPNGKEYQPDVSFDGAKVAFIRKTNENVGQVFVMEIGNPGSLQQVTNNPSPKSFPRWSAQGHLAFASGSNIVILDSNLTPIDLAFSPQRDGGLDFYDNGNKLVYERDDNLYVTALDYSIPETKITNCTSPPVLCRFPIVSHDQTKLAYHVTIMLGGGWAEQIRVVDTGSWGFLSSIVMGPALGGGGKIHSFDFSPTDGELYVSGRPYDPATVTYANEPVLFAIDIDGSNKERLLPNPPVRYPSTYR